MILEDSVDAIKEGTPSPHAERNNRLAWLSNAAFIVLGAAFSYFLAFVYERAYCKYFNVPDSLIRPDLGTILAFAVALYTFSFSVFWLVSVLYVFFHPGEKRKVSAISRFIRSRGILLLLAIIIAAAYQWNKYGWITIGIILSTLFVLDFVPAIFTKKKHKTFNMALHASMDGTDRMNSVWVPIKRRLGEQVFTLYLLCWCAVSVAGALGQSAAERQTRFLVPDLKPDSIVVKMYGNYAICISIDRAGKKTGKELTILNLQESSPTRLHWEKLGPFKENRDGKGRLPVTKVDNMPVIR
jgi:hypothetical protein